MNGGGMVKEAVFHRLYDTYHQDVFRFLVYLVKDQTTAEDLSHEVYMRVLKAYDQFEHKSSEKTWLFSIAKNVAIDHFRKQAVRERHNMSSFNWEQEQLRATTPTPEQTIMLEDDMQQLMHALEQCTGDQKMVIVLRFIQQLSVQETAEALEWTEAKVKTTQHRAMKALKQILNKEKEARTL